MKTTPIAICALALALLAPPIPLMADTEDECREMAADEEVPAEDMEDFMAECLAAASSDEAEDQDHEDDHDQPSER